MSEQQTPEQELEALRSEVTTLRKVHGEIVTSKQAQKTKIDELTQQLAEANERADNAEANIHELTVKGPLKAMAKELSTVPDTFLDVFSKTYKVKYADGKLALFHASNGKPVLAANEAKTPIPFEENALRTLLLSDSDPAALAFYKATTIVSRANATPGGRRSPFNGGQQHVTEASEKPFALQFGLR